MGVLFINTIILNPIYKSNSCHKRDSNEGQELVRWE